MPLTPQDLAAIRRIVREEVTKALAPATTLTKTFEPEGAVSGVICGVIGRTGVCTKPLGHGQRHHYGTRPTRAHLRPVREPLTAWQPMASVILPGTGSRRYSIAVGSPVRVKGFGRKTSAHPGGCAEAGWTVTKIEQRTGKPEDVNVTVSKPNHHPRTVKLDRLEYVRPSSRAGRLSDRRATVSA